MGSMELPRYNEYLDIIKDQINCANEATAILQKTYNELQSVDQNFQPGFGIWDGIPRKIQPTFRTYTRLYLVGRLSNSLLVIGQLCQKSV